MDDRQITLPLHFDGDYRDLTDSTFRRQIEFVVNNEALITRFLNELDPEAIEYSGYNLDEYRAVFAFILYMEAAEPGFTQDDDEWEYSNEAMFFFPLLELISDNYIFFNELYGNAPGAAVQAQNGEEPRRASKRLRGEEASGISLGPNKKSKDRDMVTLNPIKSEQASVTLDNGRTHTFSELENFELFSRVKTPYNYTYTPADRQKINNLMTEMQRKGGKRKTRKGRKGRKTRKGRKGGKSRKAGKRRNTRKH
jgi:hypothetical protein